MSTTPLARIDAQGLALPTAEADLHAGEALHRLFRPAISADYAAAMALIAADGGRLVHLVDEGEVRALAVWRVFHTTYCGRRLEVDDLVTDERARSRGYGATLLGWLEDQAAALGCPTITLQSATHRTEAHRFYFRQRYSVIAFHFSKAVAPRGVP